MLTNPMVMLAITFGLLFFFSLKGVKFSIPAMNSERYLCKDDTDWLRGIAILFIVYGHYSANYEVNYLFNAFGDMGVSIFFLLSGYGLMFSKQRKSDYLKNFIPKKFLRIWAPFAISFVFALIIDLFVGTEFKNNLMVEFLVLSLPNTTNWYLKVQLIMYIVFWFVSLLLKNKNNYIFISSFFVLGIVYIIIGSVLNLEWFWFQNVLYFPMGMLLAIHKENFYEIINKKYWLSLLLSVILFIVGFSLVFFIGGSVFYHMIYLFSFTNLVFVLMGKVCGNSKVLKFFGRYSIEVYLSHTFLGGAIWFIEPNNILYLIPYLFFTVVFAIIIKYLSGLIIKGADKLLDKRNNMA